METNFKCNDCGTEMYIPKYSIGFNKDGLKEYKNEHKQLLQCEKCKSFNLKNIEQKLSPGETFGTGILKFNMASNEEKKRILAKRSQDHFNNHIKEKKEYMDKTYTGRKNNEL